MCFIFQKKCFISLFFYGKLEYDPCICVFLQLESQFSVGLSLKRAEQRILSLYLITIRKSWSKPNLSTPEWRMATKIAKICHFEKKIVSFSKFQNQTTSQFLARISSKLYLILTPLNPYFCHFIYLSRHLSVTRPPPHTSNKT